MSNGKIEKTEDQWREELTEEQFRVTREAGTEPPFSGKYNVHENKGEYSCICCRAVLFDWEQKFPSSCGWPAFSDAQQEAVGTRCDTSHGMQRTEIFCLRCDAHLGHVFEDGPGPKGLRYCVNSASLAFTDLDTQEDDGKA